MHTTPPSAQPGTPLAPAPGFDLTAYHEMGQFSRYVRPGARRIRVTSPSDSVKVSGFSKDGKLTFVAINEGVAPVSIRIRVSGQSSLAGITLVRTSQTEKLATIGRMQVEGASFNVRLPGRSISTLVQ